ncbi:MAG TPA: DUF3090 domain-containing protein [Anaerolineales bacterium]|nr:DUF3090 domain-containing protein [Anaerolineales bacterium]
MEYELNPVTRITTGAIGPPGKRVFYLQARHADGLLTLLVEKQQIQALAVGLEQFLKELREKHADLPQATADFTDTKMELEQPIDPAFRVGQLGLAYDEPSDKLILVARESEAEGQEAGQASVARFWCTRSQMRSMCQWGLELSGRGRPICGNCGEPKDPEGHFCPKSNGHKH